MHCWCSSQTAFYDDLDGQQMKCVLYLLTAQPTYCVIYEPYRTECDQVMFVQHLKRFKNASLLVIFLLITLSHK